MSIKEKNTLQREPVAVIGMGALYPGAGDLKTYWQIITEARDEMQQVPASHWLTEDFYDPELGATDRIYTDRGGFIDGVDLDVIDTGVTPNSLATTDVSQLLALHVAKQVLLDAGVLNNTDLKQRSSVILGMGGTALMSEISGRLGEPVWRRVLKESGLPDEQVNELVKRMLDYFPEWKETTFPGLLGNVIAGRIANRLDLHGTNCTVDAACASSFSALSMALNELYLGYSDLVLTGGVDVLNHPLMYMCFAQTGALSRTGDCRPFSDQADGTMLGEGIGMLALRRLSDAERDGDIIHAVIRACGSSSDGLSKSVYAPVADGQAIALQRTYEMADYEPATVELLEAHGTATAAGDAAEFEGLKQVFNTNENRKQWCALGSVKSQIGHTKGAAGAAGLIKSILALQHKVLPPTIKVAKVNPKLDIENSPFYINTRPRPWVRDASHPRRAAASALGFGGSNFHVTVEEYTGTGQQAPRLQLSPVEAVLLHSDTVDAVIKQCGQLREQKLLPGSLRYLAYKTQHEVDLSNCVKLVLLANDEQTLAGLLDKAITLLSNNKATDKFEHYDDQIFISIGIKAEKTAILFPGQGSQYPGMGGDLAMFQPEAQAVWDRAATVLADNAPHHAVFPPPALDETQAKQQELFLRRSEQAQPALGVCALANWKVLAKLGIGADALAGHSFGEVVALHVAGVFDETALFKIAAKRGALMAEAAADSKGAMSAVIGDNAIVTRIVESIGSGLVIANHNSPTQTVISGSDEAIIEAEQQLQQQGLRVIRLPVATAFHSSIVSGASEPFLKSLQQFDFRKPATPVIGCSTARNYASTAPAARKTLAEQLAKPVRFVEQVQQLYAMGVRNFVEVGAGSVLSKLVAECLSGQEHRAIHCDQKGGHGVIALYRALARLSIAAISVEWSALWKGVAVPIDPLTVKKPKLTKQVNGSNIDRPYPPKPGTPNLHPPMAFFTNKKQPEQTSLQSKRQNPSNHEKKKEQQVETMTTTDLTSANRSKVVQQVDTVVANNNSGVQHVLLAAQQQYQAAMQAMQQSMTDAHLTYLQAVQTMQGGAGHVAQIPVPVRTTQQTSLPVTPILQPAVITPPVKPVTQVAEQPPEIAVSTATPAEVENCTVINNVAPLKTAQEGAQQASVVDLFLDVVADKTGYPREVLELDMEMESGLGIDSIKRVEILAELQNQLPDLTELDVTQLAVLATLQDVVSAVEQGMVGQAVITPDVNKPVPAPAKPQPTTTLQGTAIAAEKPQNILELFLAVVAEKTGYPREVLELDMEMESGLGIDSIKRVEIFAELQNQRPDLVELDVTQLAGLSTLAEVVEAVEQASDAGHIVVQAIERAKQPEKKKLTEKQHRHVVQLETVPTPGFSLTGLFKPGVIGISGDQTGIAGELVALLSQSGLQARVIQDHATLPEDLIGLICLHGLQKANSAQAGITQQIELVKHLQNSAGRLQGNKGFLVLVQAGEGDFGLQDKGQAMPAMPWNRGLVALARTARLEWPGVTCRYIDCDPTNSQLAQTLVDELFNGGDIAEVGLSVNGQRYQLVDKAQPLTRGSRSLPKGSVCVVAGGGRGVTAACVIAMAKQQSLRLALLGRSELVAEPEACRDSKDEVALIKVLSQGQGKPDLPQIRRQAKAILASREIKQTLQQLRAAGSEAEYYCTDIQDKVEVKQALHTIRQQWGPVDGIIHAAGVLADKQIVDKTEQQLAQVMQTKLIGLEVLLAATQDDPLQLIVMFSSVAARYGNIGQCDYAMANEVLNQLALSLDQKLAQQRPRCLVKSLMWGPWDGGMVTPALKKHFAEMQVPLIDLQQGANWFVDELSNSNDVLVVLGEGRELSKPVLSKPELSKSNEQQTGNQRFEIVVNAHQQPHLLDHAVDGKVVVPVVQIIEWFVSAARSLHGSAVPISVEDFRVLSGIKLADFNQQQTILRLELNARTEEGCEARLLDENNRCCYRARLTFNQPAIKPDDEFARPAKALKPWPIETKQSYSDETLFHGPSFHVIHKLETIAEDGGIYQLKTNVDQHWFGAPWLTQPALLDGCLQMSSLWSRCQRQVHCLPMSIKRLVWFTQDKPQDSAICYAKITAQNNALLADILVLDHQQRPVVFLEGVESIIYARATEALAVK